MCKKEKKTTTMFQPLLTVVYNWSVSENEFFTCFWYDTKSWVFFFMFCTCRQELKFPSTATLVHSTLSLYFNVRKKQQHLQFKHIQNMYSKLLLWFLLLVVVFLLFFSVKLPLALNCFKGERLPVWWQRRQHFEATVNIVVNALGLQLKVILIIN